MDSGTGRFPFPFQPYPIQEQFMEALYATLEQGKVGIFESPTGTVSRGSCLLHRKTSYLFHVVIVTPHFSVSKVSVCVRVRVCVRV